MAKNARTPAVVPQPGYSPGYTWILLFSFLAVLGGCFVHYLELSADYDMEAEPKGLAAVPKVEPLPPIDTTSWKGGISRAPVDAPADVASALTNPIPELPDNPVHQPARQFVGPVVVRLPSLLPGLGTR